MKSLPERSALLPIEMKVREPEREAIGVLDDGQAESARLRQEADVPLHRRVGREGGVHANVVMGVDHTHAVGADDAHAALAGDAISSRCNVAAGGAGLGKAGGDHDHAVDALLGALAGGGHDQLGRDDDHGEVDWARNVQDRLVGVKPTARRRRRVDRVDRAVEPAVHQVCGRPSPPMEPRLRPAPITATERGASMPRTAFIEAILIAGLEAGLRLGRHRRGELDADLAWLGFPW